MIIIIICIIIISIIIIIPIINIIPIITIRSHFGSSHFNLSFPRGAGSGCVTAALTVPSSSEDLRGLSPDLYIGAGDLPKSPSSYMADISISYHRCRGPSEKSLLLRWLAGLSDKIRAIIEGGPLDTLVQAFNTLFQDKAEQTLAAALEARRRLGW